MRWLRSFIKALLLLVMVAGLSFVFFKVRDWMTLTKVIHNLTAQTRVAEVLVTESRLNELTQGYTTTIKFLEYDVQGESLKPKYFTFEGNQIQFQSLVVRFDDQYVERGHSLKGKSIHLFLKAFVLDNDKAQTFEITPINEVPGGYQVHKKVSRFEKMLWQHFWKYALDPAQRMRLGVKNAQLEAPGSVFVPGTIYTLLIEHDGGLRIDTRPIPKILEGENLKS